MEVQGQGLEMCVEPIRYDISKQFAMFETADNKRALKIIIAICIQAKAKCNHISSHDKVSENPEFLCQIDLWVLGE